MGGTWDQGAADPSGGRHAMIAKGGRAIPRPGGRRGRHSPWCRRAAWPLVHPGRRTGGSPTCYKGTLGPGTRGAHQARSGRTGTKPPPILRETFPAAATAREREIRKVADGAPSLARPRHLVQKGSAPRGSSRGSVAQQQREPLPITRPSGKAANTAPSGRTEYSSVKQ